jgi:hypothetical protein
VQSAGELAQKMDYFTEKSWWRNRNFETGTNAKAPQALWLFKDTALGDVLGLQEHVNKGEDRASYLKMDPRWSWFFGSMPGFEPALADVSAFFRTPEQEGGLPEFTPGRGAARQVGFPVYDVPLLDAKRQTYEFRKALAKSAPASMTEVGGQLVPDNTTFMGREIAGFMDRAKHLARTQKGMTVKQADEYALELARLKYPNEWRILTLQDRLQRWTDWLTAIDEGKDELTRGEQQSVTLAARRADASRTDHYQKRKEREQLAKLGLKLP